MGQRKWERDEDRQEASYSFVLKSAGSVPKGGRER